jgi:putative intracellular protease/amidase
MRQRGDETMTTVSGDRQGGTREGRPERPCALLWEESFLWGVMARQALADAGLPFDFLRAEDIRTGALEGYRLLFVPGGWASNKGKALGPQGKEAIRRFVGAGGNYLGICGGAGLATRDGLGLLPVGRKPGAERVPSFSGPIRVATDDPLLLQGTESPVFHAWWPSQFRVDGADVRVIATYQEAQAGAMSADVPIEAGVAQGWASLEGRYGILLDPGRLVGEPAVVEGRFGTGRVLLSLLHFDTPGDPNGAAVLRNLWDALATGVNPRPTASRAIKGPFASADGTEISSEVRGSLAAVEAIVGDLIAEGQRLSLWQWRTPWLLGWRRGVRGLEASTLAVMTSGIRRHLEHRCPGAPGGSPCPSGFPDPAPLIAALEAIHRPLVPFVEKAKRLLALERDYLQTAILSPLTCEAEGIRRLRTALFGSGMSHGGQFKWLLDALDALLWDLERSDPVAFSPPPARADMTRGSGMEEISVRGRRK